MPSFFFFFLHKEWQITLGLHWVLVTLHGRFAIRYGARQIQSVTLNIKFSDAITLEVIERAASSSLNIVAMICMTELEPHLCPQICCTDSGYQTTKGWRNMIFSWPFSRTLHYHLMYLKDSPPKSFPKFSVNMFLHKSSLPPKCVRLFWGDDMESCIWMMFTSLFARTFLAHSYYKLRSWGRGSCVRATYVVLYVRIEACY